MVIGVIILLIALVILFFPFVFKIEFRVDMAGAKARVFLFKKNLYDGEKKFKEESLDKTGAVDRTDTGRADSEDDDAFVPSYVPSAKKAVVKTEDDFGEFDLDAVKSSSKPLKVVSIEESAPAGDATSAQEVLPVGDVSDVVELTSTAPSKKSEKIAALKAAENEDLEPAQEKSGEESSKSETAPEKNEKPDRRKKLTETEFWTIILTPEFDSTAFWAVKKLVASLLRLFRIKFNDCYVEGIRADYETMGYGAALNGILKSFPFVGAWDLRMDWTRDHELCAQGEIRGTINVFRIFVVVFTALFYGGIVAFKFWRRRAHVLKTHELPELGWIRSKIVKMLAEE